MTRSGRILVVDDEAIARRDLAARLAEVGFDVETAADAFKALGKLAAFAPHVVVTDQKMPGMCGIELVHKLLALAEPPSVIVMTGFSEIDTAVEAIRSGAADYLGKPLDFAKLVALLDKALERVENRQLERRPPDLSASIIGESPAMRRVFQVIDHVSPSSANVVLAGERGTGKELIARTIHQRSQRAGGPFVTLHCRALRDSLSESELCEQIQHADDGTVFLAEIEALSASVQVQLLRVLHDCRPDVRVIAGTECDLSVEVAGNRFRDDLYYRLGVVTIEVVPLRERGGDIVLLAKHFLGRFARRASKRIDGFSPDAIERLAAHTWPGNVRELENAVERAVIFAPGPLLEAKYLPTAIHATPGTRRAPRIPGATLAELTRYAILETLEATGGSTTKAAEILGISARTIQYKLHEYSEAPESAADVLGKTS